MGWSKELNPIKHSVLTIFNISPYYHHLTILGMTCVARHGVGLRLIIKVFLTLGER